MSDSKKVIKYKKTRHINIGIIIFGFVFLYFFIYLISYVTDKHVTIYEVQKGEIVRNSSYKGLVLRDEVVTNSNTSGDINYYIKEGGKAGYDDIICSIDRDGSISKKISSAGTDISSLTAEDLAKIRLEANNFVSEQSDNTFFDVYSFKDDINSSIAESLYLDALNDLQKETSGSNSTFTMVRAEKDGVLAFYTDGYEDVTIDNFRSKDYDPSSYTKTNLRSRVSVKSGEALYKTISTEDWYLMVPISEEEAEIYSQQIKEGQETFIIYVTFLKDQRSAYAVARIKDYNGEGYLVLKFNSSMVRYISDRYLEVELGSDNTTGLKIPNTSIISKEFIIVPDEYITKGGNTNSDGVMKVPSGKKTSSDMFTTVSVFYSKDGYTYIDKNGSISIGDVLMKPESTETYTVSETGTIDGVYNMNKGYAVFKQIDVLASNEEYSIVKTGTKYGLALYDRIALDGTSVKEGEIAN